jgi:protocatechuate 3,4-dioxygenase beta subunit
MKTTQNLQGTSQQEDLLVSRRHFLRRMASGLLVASGGAALMNSVAFAEELVRTPPQMEGPFYPDRLPLDKDNDLLIINKSITPAVGQITHLSGRILDARGNPVGGAVIEIWQVDNNGAYLHTQDPEGARRDRNFQGFGRFETGKSGEYRFRTIKPVSYPGRTPHIHVKVLKGSRELLTTQPPPRHSRFEATSFAYRAIRANQRIAHWRIGGSLRHCAGLDAFGINLDFC